MLWIPEAYPYSKVKRSIIYVGWVLAHHLYSSYVGWVLTHHLCSSYVGWVLTHHLCSSFATGSRHYDRWRKFQHNL
jgi:hypothetical protein